MDIFLIDNIAYWLNYDGQIDFNIISIVPNHYLYSLDKQQFIDFLASLLYELEQQFLLIKDSNQQKQFLNRVKKVITSTSYPKDFGKIDLRIKNYEFGRQYIKLKEETTKA